MSKDRDLFHTALHESGHAVLCLFQHVPFDSVSIVPDRDSLGRVCLAPLSEGDNEDSFDSLMRRAIATHGGALAVAQVSRDIAAAISGTDGDIEILGNILIAWEPDDEARDLLNRYFQRKARYLIEEYEGEIEKLARELVKRKEMNRDDVYECLIGIRPSSMA